MIYAPQTIWHSQRESHKIYTGPQFIESNTDTDLPRATQELYEITRECLRRIDRELAEEARNA